MAFFYKERRRGAGDGPGVAGETNMLLWVLSFAGWRLLFIASFPWALLLLEAAFLYALKRSIARRKARDAVSGAGGYRRARQRGKRVSGAADPALAAPRCSGLFPSDIKS